MNKNESTYVSINERIKDRALEEDYIVFSEDENLLLNTRPFLKAQRVVDSLSIFPASLFFLGLSCTFFYGGFYSVLEYRAHLVVFSIFLFFAFSILYYIYLRGKSNYYLTNQRIIIVQYRLLGKRQTSIYYNKIVKIYLNRNEFHRHYDTGQIAVYLGEYKIDSEGTSFKYDYLEYLNDYKKVMKIIQDGLK
ncbi:MAG: PH domain-containing protein [Cytophagaceae bacterium]